LIINQDIIKSVRHPHIHKKYTRKATYVVGAKRTKKS
jgi:hypothetical protein